MSKWSSIMRIADRSDKFEEQYLSNYKMKVLDPKHSDPEHPENPEDKTKASDKEKVPQ